MTTNAKVYTLCKICGVDQGGAYALAKHRREAHPDQLRKSRVVVTANESAFNKLLDAKKQMIDALKGLEAERDQHQARILEIDNILAASKKWQ